MIKIINLTKDYILDNVSQEKIFEEFLNININFNIKYKSWFRDEDDESASFFYKGSKLLLNDWGSFYGDCFALVARLHSLDCTTGKGFMLTLEIIAKRFGLLEGTYIEKKIERNHTIVLKKKIDPVVTDFDYRDYKYWETFNVSKSKLKAGRVFKCMLIYLDDKLIYTESYNNPAYLFIYSKVDFTIYFPFKEKKNRFIKTSNCIQGTHLLKGLSNTLVITKSYKDVLSLTSFLLGDSKIHIEAIAIGSEGALINKEFMLKLKERYKYIFTLFDYDPSGLHCTWIHREKYQTIPLLIHQKTWNSKIKYPTKDFTDLLKEGTNIYGVKEGIARMQTFINSVIIKLQKKYDIK